MIKLDIKYFEILSDDHTRMKAIRDYLEQGFTHTTTLRILAGLPAERKEKKEDDGYAD